MNAIKFRVNESPELKYLIPFSLQHVLTMLGATVAVPTIIAGQLNLDSIQTALLISNVLLCMGIATCLQVMFGTKLPIIQGSSFAFLPPLLLIATQYNSDPELALRYISGAIIIGSIFQFFLGFLGIAGLIQKILTPVVVGPVIIIIGLSLFKVGASQAGTFWPIAILTIGLIFSVSYCYMGRKNGGFLSKIRTIPVLISVIAVYLICYFMSISGVFEVGHPANIDLSKVSSNNIIRNTIPFFSWGTPIFSFPFFITILFAYAVSTFESIGDYNAIAEISGFSDDIKDNQGKINEQHIEIDKISSKRVNKGVMTEGIGCFISGVIGGLPTTSYSENVGLIGVTGVASKKIVLVAGLILIIAGLFPVIGMFLSSIPSPIMGGLYCVLFGMITGIGIKITSQCDTSSMRNLSIIGFCLFMAFSIPEYYSQEDILKEIHNNFSKTYADIISGILGSQMAVAAILGLILDNILPKNINTTS